MAPAMKVTLKWEEGAEATHAVLKLTLPRKWREGATKQLKETFVDQYNKKHEDTKLELDEVHLVNTKGQALADADLVARVIEHGEHVRVKPGPSPTKLAAPLPAKGSDASAAKSDAKASKGANVPTPMPASGSNLVGDKAALDKARKIDFDYSKWDRLDLSDDDAEDCHPNIDKESWKRLMAQKRQDRRQKEEEKIAAFKAKIEKYKKKYEDLQGKIDGAGADDDDAAQWMVDRDDAKDSMDKYQARLDHFLATRKLTADDLCDVKDDKTTVASSADMTPLDTGLPQPAKSPAASSSASSSSSSEPSKAIVRPEAPVDEGLEYDAYIKLHRVKVDKFADLRSDEASEHFLLENPVILHKHAEGYLLLRTLDTCMRHLGEEEDRGGLSAKLKKAYAEEELAIARQHMIIQFVLALAEGKHRDPRDFVRAFFLKAGKNSTQRVDGFEQDLESFVDRIRNRAKEKRSKGEESPLAYHNRDDVVQLDDGEYEMAPLGPGGLDPNEVLGTLPRAMQEAFISQDTDKLREAVSSLTAEEAQYHMQRCVDSGLWNPGPDEVEADDEAEDN
ncbi:Hsp90 co-chaperone Cdc37 [Hondaea fermentalgiana]|uniref:Hsp90 chaperone protein kinase-targeting subunit n=1 Tax=Hondaea fermentalgiana TaxID=2315210 RepID=A0A2R5G9H2_9STRA|nr:Hsp90 co-chaperone Cdc37 [Hondaea fermentalgiana]|eukprot:GBG24324.1 Hsp90 co-chaperone Cdc37 [Hondaea fermentalgiana]